MSPVTDQISPVRVPSRFSRSAPWLVVAFFILVGVARIVSIYHIFNEVFDEAPHIACGAEWWEKGTYNYERKHTPLGRIAAAFPFYARGIHSEIYTDCLYGLTCTPSYWKTGHTLLYTNNEYFKNLAWARSGMLPFFVFSNILLALWAYRWWGPWTAVATVGLFSCIPPILGHAAVTTTDMPATWGMIATAYAFCLWIEKPNAKRTIVLGVAFALALLCKLSVAMFFLPAAVIILAWAAYRKLPVGLLSPIPLSKQLRYLVVASLIAAMVIWAPYHFRFAAISTGHGYRPAASGRLATVVNFLLDTKLPLGEFLGGLGSVVAFNNLGYMAFFKGAYRDHGWWNFFPTVLALKTPISFLLLFFLGIPLALRRLRGAQWQQGVPLIFAAAILAICMMSGLSLGVRHILPIYPMLALVAAPALVGLFEHARQHRWMGVVAAVLVVSFAAESAWAHPDYLAWFNVLAGQHPENIVVSSDLDWGQDLERLSIRLKELKVPSVSLLYSGAADVNRFGLPPFVELKPQDNPTGWVACSVTRMMLDCAKDGNYCSWKSRTPVERVGRSIYLFYVPPDGK